jgi:hypothetical protein
MTPRGAPIARQASTQRPGGTRSEPGVLDKISFFKVEAISDELGVVYGKAIVCTENGEAYYDLQGDHIPENSMEHSGLEFGLGERIGKEMHRGERKGSFPFLMPITAETKKAFGIECNWTGLAAGFKPDTPELLGKFKDGTYKGFSIGGKRLVDEPQLEDA